MPTKTALRLMTERNQPTCEVLGCDNPAEEAHHVFYGRKKGHPELDTDENFQLVCQDCHKYSGKAKAFVNKVLFWQVQCERYGEDRMLTWHNGVNLKVKERVYV